MIDLYISIHVPLAGNVRIYPTQDAQSRISIHVPLAGNVDIICDWVAVNAKFLSTFPLRGTSRDPRGSP